MFVEPDQSEYAEFVTLFIQCESSYIHDGGYSSLCYGGVWHPDPSLTACHASCPIPAVDSDVKHFDKATKVSESERYLHDTVIRYKCVQNKGVFEGTKTATCIDGNWDPPEVPICRDKCFAPPNVLPVKPLAYKHGTAVVFACVAGILSNGIISATCNDGIWSADIICSVPPATTTESPRVLTTEKQITTIRTTFGVPDCVYPDLGTQSAYLEPYQLHGYQNLQTAYLYCSETIPYVSQVSVCYEGIWLPPLPTEICKDPCPVPAENRMTYSQLSGHTDGVIFTHGSRLSVTCEIGDPGATTLTCNDGVWEPLISCPDPTTSSPYSTSTISTARSTSEEITSDTSYEPYTSRVHTEFITDRQPATSSNPAVAYTSDLMSTLRITQLIHTDSKTSTIANEGTTDNYMYTPSGDMMTSMQTEYQTGTVTETTIPSLRTTSFPSNGFSSLPVFTELGVQTDVLTDTLVMSPSFPTSEQMPVASIPSTTQETPLDSTSQVTMKTEMYTDYITGLVTETMYSSTQETIAQSSSESWTTHFLTERQTEKVTTESLLTEILTFVFSTPTEEDKTLTGSTNSGAADFTSLPQLTELVTQTVTERLPTASLSTSNQFLKSSTAPTTVGIFSVDSESPFRITRTLGTDSTSSFTELATQITEMTEVFTADVSSTSERPPESSITTSTEEAKTEESETSMQTETKIETTLPFSRTTYSEANDSTSPPQFTELGTQIFEMTEKLIFPTSQQTQGSSFPFTTEKAIATPLRTTRPQVTDSTRLPQFTEFEMQTNEFTEEFTTVSFSTSVPTTRSAVSPTTEDILTNDNETSLETTPSQATGNSSLPQYTNIATQTIVVSEALTTDITSTTDQSAGSSFPTTTEDISTVESKTSLHTARPQDTQSTSLPHFTELETKTTESNKDWTSAIFSTSQRTPESSVPSTTENILTEENPTSLRITSPQATDFTSPSHFTEIGTQIIEQTRALTTGIVSISVSTTTEDFSTPDSETLLPTIRSEALEFTSLPLFTEHETQAFELTETLTTSIFLTSQKTPKSSVESTEESETSQQTKTDPPTKPTSLRNTRDVATHFTSWPQFTELGTQTVEVTEVSLITDVVSTSQRAPASSEQSTTEQIPTRDTSDYTQTSELIQSSPSNFLTSPTTQEQTELVTSKELLNEILTTGVPSSTSAERYDDTTVFNVMTSDIDVTGSKSLSNTETLPTTSTMAFRSIETVDVTNELTSSQTLDMISKLGISRPSTIHADTTSLFAYTDQGTEVWSDSNTDLFPSATKQEPTTTEGDSTKTDFATEVNESTSSVLLPTDLPSSVLTEDIPSTAKTLFQSKSTHSTYVTITDIFETETRPSTSMDTASDDSTTERGINTADDNINTSKEAIVTSKETGSLTDKVTETPFSTLRTTHSRITDVTSLPVVTDIETQRVATTEALTKAEIYSSSKQTPGNIVPTTTDGTSTTYYSTANGTNEIIDNRHESYTTKVVTEVSMENTDISQSSIEQKPTTLETNIITTDSDQMYTIGTEVITGTFTDIVSDTKPHPSETNSPSIGSHFYSTLPSRETTTGSKLSTENPAKDVSKSYMTLTSNTSPRVFTDLFTKTNDLFSTNIFTDEVTKEPQSSDFTADQTSSLPFKSHSSDGYVSYENTVLVSTHPSTSNLSTTETMFSTASPQVDVTDINTERETLFLTDNVAATDITKQSLEITSSAPISTSTETFSFTAYGQRTTQDDSSTPTFTTKQGISNTGIFTDMETLGLTSITKTVSTSVMEDASTHSPTSSESTSGTSSMSTRYVTNVSEDSLDKTTAAEIYVTTYRDTTTGLPSPSYSQTAENTLVTTEQSSTFKSATPEKEVTSDAYIYTATDALTTNVLKTLSHSTDVTEDTTDISIDITDWSSIRVTVSRGALSTQPKLHTKTSEITNSLAKTTVPPTTLSEYIKVSTMDDSTSVDRTPISQITTSQSISSGLEQTVVSSTDPSSSLAADETTTSPAGSRRIITESMHTVTTRHDQDPSTLQTKLLQTMAPSQSMNVTLVIILGTLAGVAFILGLVTCCMCCLWMSILRSRGRRRRRDSALGDDLDRTVRQSGVLYNPYFNSPATSQQTSITTLPISKISTN